MQKIGYANGDTYITIFILVNQLHKQLKMTNKSINKKEASFHPDWRGAARCGANNFSHVTSYAQNTHTLMQLHAHVTATKRNLPITAVWFCNTQIYAHGFCVRI